MIDTLVTNRTASDLAAMNEKGTYSSADLNRVSAAMSYLSRRFRDYGYSSAVHQKTVQTKYTNLIPNGNFTSGLSGWSASGDIALDGKSVKFTPTAGLSMLSRSLSAPVKGHKYYGRLRMKTSAPIATSDNRFEWYHSDQPGETLVFGRKEGNYPAWGLVSAEITAGFSLSDWTLRNFFVTLSGADVWVTDQMIVDLTETFGGGREPNTQWCDSNIPYIDGTQTADRVGWLMGDVPTEWDMDVYLNDLRHLRSVFAVLSTTPPVPEDMEDLWWYEANDIEQILVDVDTVLNRIAASFQRSGSFMFYSGNRPLPT